MIDIESSSDILFNHAYETMAPKLWKKLKPYDHELYRFNSQPLKVSDIISLPMDLGNEKHITKHDIDFLVVGSWLPYGTILINLLYQFLG